MNSEKPTRFEVIEDSPENQRPLEGLQLHVSSEQDKDDTEYRPSGPIYSLNSRRLKVVHLQQIADSLRLPMKGTVAVTRQLIEGKLMEVDQEPENVQVSQVWMRIMFVFN